MIRRKTSNMPISMADKQHLHHRLLNLGFTHRGAVLTIYAIAVRSACCLFYDVSWQKRYLSLEHPE
jgi:UDP-N-acetylmuramyl pentapeptide phosphotransferase/UDP-N-acetylglucosamine-1-phosphate transferase